MSSTRGSIFLEQVRVISQLAYDAEQFVLRLAAPKCAAHAAPGSFVHITCDPSIPMRRPLSIMRAAPAAGWIELLYKVVGAGLHALAARKAGDEVSVLSGGEAHVSHPTQGLLDALTVYQHKQRFAGLAVAMVGDIRHSRVARSAWHAFSKLGVSDLRLAAPAALMPEREEFAGCTRHSELASALAGADAIMMLRIQRERISEADLPVGEQYFAAWGLTRERLALARPDAIVMHPQPMNRGIEIASDVADGPQSVIRDQVRNGVAVRMAVLAEVLGAPG